LPLQWETREQGSAPVCLRPGVSGRGAAGVAGPRK